jgi:hypothetical protein
VNQTSEGDHESARVTLSMRGENRYPHMVPTTFPHINHIYQWVYTFCWEGGMVNKIRYIKSVAHAYRERVQHELIMCNKTQILLLHHVYVLVEDPPSIRHSYVQHTSCITGGATSVHHSYFLSPTRM